MELYRETQHFTGERYYKAILPSGLWDSGVHIWAERRVYIQPPPPPRPVPPNFTAVSYQGANATLTWANQGSYTAVIVERSTPAGGWEQIGRPHGTATTFTDTRVPFNQKFHYRIASSVSAGGTSDWRTSAPVFSIPATPGNVRAERQGSNISVTATAPSTFITGYQVRDAQTQTTLATGTSLPWIHTGADASKTHQYQVRAYINSAHGTRYSDWSTPSNTVSLLSAPAAPTPQLPAGGVLLKGNTKFQWIHNPTDSSTQQQYQVGYQKTGSSETFTTGSTSNQHTVYLQPGTYDWRVRTRGAHATWSPFSRTTRFEIITQPTVDLQIPASYTKSTATITWSFGQAENKPQQAYKAELLDAAGQVIGTRHHVSTSRTTTFTTPLANNTNYRARITVQAAGYWSNPATATFTTNFPAPAPPTVTAVWDESLGGVNLNIIGATSNPAATRNTIERSTDAGETWQQIAETSSTGLVADLGAKSAGETLYRITSYTAAGGLAARTITSLPTAPQFGFPPETTTPLSVRLPYNPSTANPNRPQPHPTPLRRTHQPRRILLNPNHQNHS